MEKETGGYKEKISGFPNKKAINLSDDGFAKNGKNFIAGNYLPGLFHHGCLFLLD